MFGNFVNLNGIMSSESNTFFLERLMNNHDAFKAMGIIGDNDGWPDKYDFVVRVQLELARIFHWQK